MITGLPQFKPPVCEPVRCACRKFYFVFTGENDLQARSGKRQAGLIGAVFVDARQTPFMNCECGQILDFAPECSLMVQ